MNKNSNSDLTNISKILRRNMTKEEKHLWYDFLKKLPKTFYRQKVIGNYIVDFCCAVEKVVIELDGSQHYEEQGIIKDKQRDDYLKSQGYCVLRYTNIQIHERFDEVCIDILKHVNLL